MPWTGFHFEVAQLQSSAPIVKLMSLEKQMAPRSASSQAYFFHNHLKSSCDFRSVVLSGTIQWLAKAITWAALKIPMAESSPKGYD
jgi:hypothetical protein